MVLAAMQMDSRSARVVVLLFCACVLMQALGAPITLWNPSWSGDTLQTSVLEGFSIPPSIDPLWLVLQADALPAVVVHGRLLLRDLSLFHPPTIG